MECPACCEQMTALMDGELSPVEAKPVEDHLHHCPKCRAEYESLTFSYRLVEGIDDSTLALPPWPTLATRLKPEEGPARESWWPLPWGNWVPVTATTAVVVLGVFLLMPPRPNIDAETARRFNLFVAQREEDEELLDTAWGLVDEGDLPNPFTLVSTSQFENPFQSE